MEEEKRKILDAGHRCLLSAIDAEYNNAFNAARLERERNINAAWDLYTKELGED